MQELQLKKAQKMIGTLLSRKLSRDQIGVQNKDLIQRLAMMEAEVSKVRELLGPTNSKVAPKGTIRGDFGTEMMRNVCHASDSPAAAEAEVRRFFRPDEVFLPEASRV